MAASSRCSGGGVCQPLATLGYDGHAVNDTILAYGQLLVDDPERIGPIQATGMDQTLFNREYRTQQWATTFDSPLKSEGPRNGPLAVCVTAACRSDLILYAEAHPCPCALRNLAAHTGMDVGVSPDQALSACASSSNSCTSKPMSSCVCATDTSHCSSSPGGVRMPRLTPQSQLSSAVPKSVRL